MEIVEFTAAQLAVLTAAIIGATELINRLRAKDLWVAASIVTASVIGTLLALYFKADPVVGMVTGLGASGLVKTVGSFGNQSKPVESTLTKRVK